MNLSEIGTRKEVENHLESIGIVGPAAEAILGETACFRHAARTRRAAEAAMMWAENTFQQDHEPTNAMMAAFLCALDRFGVGGPMGVSGDGTLRVPAFRSLGKGRKQASDGAAWTAAIHDAIGLLIPHGGVVISPAGDVSLFVRWIVHSGTQFEEEKANCEFDTSILIMSDLKCQFLSLAREGLRRSLGMPGWFSDKLAHEIALVRDESSAPAWAALVNALTIESAVA